MCRFKYKNNQIHDELNGIRYDDYDFHNGELVKLLNNINRRADMNIEACDKIRMDKEVYREFDFRVLSIMKKYEIDSLDKLDQILFEQKVW